MTFQQMRLLNFKDKPRNLATPKKAFWGKSECFLVFHLVLLQRDLSSMWQGSWMRLWTVTSSFCSISKVADWWLLKKSMQACSTYVYLRKFFRKLEKHLSRGLFCENCSISEINTYAFIRNLLKALIAAIKDKKLPRGKSETKKKEHKDY